MLETPSTLVPAKSPDRMARLCGAALTLLGLLLVLWLPLPADAAPKGGAAGAGCVSSR